MARDYTKYNVEGLGENLNKRKLVFTVVKDYVEKNNPSFEDLQKAFPDEVHGGNPDKFGLIRKEAEVKNHRYFNMREPLKIKQGVHVVVMNQWGENIKDFIELAEKLGYSVVKSKEKSSEESLIDLTKFDPYQLNKQFKVLLENNNGDVITNLDEELESLIDRDPKFMAYAKIFEQASCNEYGYWRLPVDIYFTITEEADDLLELLQEQSLVQRIIEKHNIKKSTINEDHVDFKLLFTGYFSRNLEVLIELDNEEIIAEFIFAQSCGEEDGIELAMDGDWLNDLATDILKYIFDKDILSDDYEDGCTLHGSYFGSPVDSGLDYVKASRELIDSMI